MTARENDPLPIDPTEPMATQSRHSLMVAEEIGLLTYRWPVDMRHEAQVDVLREELGADADPPDNDGVYYLVYVPHIEPGLLPDDVPGRTTVLIPEGEVRAFVLALAAVRGQDVARRVQYMHGTLPG